MHQYRNTEGGKINKQLFKSIFYKIIKRSFILSKSKEKQAAIKFSNEEQKSKVIAN